MPGYSAHRTRKCAKSQIDKKQPSPAGVNDSSKPGQKDQDDKRLSSQGSALASAGAKRKRSEAKSSERGGHQQTSDRVSQPKGIAGSQTSTGLGSDQQKAKSPVKSPAKSPAKPRRSTRKRKARRKSIDTVYYPEDSDSDHAQPEKPASPPRKQTDSREHALKLPATSQQKNAAAAACAAASLGSPSSSHSGQSS